MVSLPHATYRLQFNKDFTFNAAASAVEYLSLLNISHIYASPYLQSAQGSTHGYDVTDPTHANNELGGEIGLSNYFAALKKNHLSQVLDLVPNHMGTKCPDNIWWMHVLKYGLQSPFASYFDIYWQASKKILLPVLANDFNQVLKTQKIRLKLDAGNFLIQYYDYAFPIAPASLPLLITSAEKYFKLQRFSALAKKLNATSLQDYSELQIIEQEFIQLLEHSPAAFSAILQTINEFNNSRNLFKQLHKLQNYQLVSWQTSNKTISYRRFFHLNSFIGLRVEDEKVFAATHQLPLHWFKNGHLTGIRVDHIDGLRNPLQYLKRLNNAFPDTWIVVEKILGSKEKLVSTWPVAGTTGYDFLNLTNGVFINSNNEARFTDFYAKFTGIRNNYHELLREKKLLVLRDLLGGDINFLTKLVMQIIKQHSKYPTFTPHAVSCCLKELIACFPVYRTYIDAANKQITKEDRATILKAIAKAKKNSIAPYAKLLDFIAKILLLKLQGSIEQEFVMRFQQLTSPAMAKGGEDTAFYCYNRFVALNEVGGDPANFGVSIKNFHQSLIAASKLWPHSMLTTSSHDTKRGEDVRARLALLSEIAVTWFTEVKKWAHYNEKFHAETVPDRNTQYFLYQNLVGAWPINRERFIAFMEKATREAKIHTSWFTPNAIYENKLRRFVKEIFADTKFITFIEKFVNPLIAPGQINSLSQVTLKLTAPGVPDIYQGSELWNFSLVDPDNRRPVDFKLRKNLFKEMLTLSIEEILKRMDAALPKLWVIYKVLGLRKQQPELFNDTNYSPLFLQGKKKNHGIAFLRGEKILVLVPRLILNLNNNWGDTYLELPQGVWKNIFTHEELPGGKLLIANMLKKFPVAVYTQQI